MLARGGTVTDFSQGAVRTLQGGAFVSDNNQVDGTKTDGTYVTTDKQFTAAEPTSIFTKKRNVSGIRWDLRRNSITNWSRPRMIRR